MTRSAVRRWRVGEGTPDIVLEQVIHTQSGQLWAPHWHEEWSIGAVIAGECRFSLAGNALVAVAGDVLAIAPMATHTCTLERSAQPGARATMVYVPLDWLARSGLRPPMGSIIAHAPPLAAASTLIGDEHAAQRWLAETLRALEATGTPLPAPATADSELDARVLRVIRRAIDSPELPEMVSLARECGISREHFQRLAASNLGMTPAAYLRTMRMTLARTRLLQGAPISDVASAGGFADQAHFTRWFRRSFGYTPGALLKAQQREG